MLNPYCLPSYYNTISGKFMAYKQVSLEVCNVLFHKIFIKCKRQNKTENSGNNINSRSNHIIMNGDMPDYSYDPGNPGNQTKKRQKFTGFSISFIHSLIHCKLKIYISRS